MGIMDSSKTRLNDFSIRMYMNFKENKKEKSNLMSNIMET